MSQRFTVFSLSIMFLAVAGAGCAKAPVIAPVPKAPEEHVRTVQPVAPTEVLQNVTVREEARDLSLADIQNATVKTSESGNLESSLVQLQGGFYHAAKKPPAYCQTCSSETTISIMNVGNRPLVAFGDIDGDGYKDAAVMLAETDYEGDSKSNYNSTTTRDYLEVFLSRDGQAKLTDMDEEDFYGRYAVDEIKGVKSLSITGKTVVLAAQNRILRLTLENGSLVKKIPAPAAIAQASIPASWKTYRDPDALFQAKYPADTEPTSTDMFGPDALYAVAFPIPVPTSGLNTVRDNTAPVSFFVTSSTFTQCVGPVPEEFSLHGIVWYKPVSFGGGDCGAGDCGQSFGYSTYLDGKCLTADFTYQYTNPGNFDFSPADLKKAEAGNDRYAQSGVALLEKMVSTLTLVK